MRKAVGLLPGWLALSLLAALQAAGGVAVHSRSGQFVIRGPRPQAMITGPGVARFPAGGRAPANVVPLDPDLLAVSVERIKQALLRELELPDQWRGRIFVDLHPAGSDEPPVLLTSLFYPDGWQYHLDLVDRLESSTVARAIVGILMLEIANRNAGSQSAELPLWLTEGMTLHLMRSAQTDLVLRPETDLVRQFIRPEPLAAAREYLRGHPPLTFTELSLPTSAQLTGEGWTNFQACAQLLVTELLHLRGGRAGVAILLSRLPQYLNWQTAFLRTFEPFFQKLLDVEKWWAVCVADLKAPASCLPCPL
jgi:hypothetical protein